MAEHLRLADLRIEAHDRCLLHLTALDVAAGAITACIGPSGAGKSLLARALLGRTLARPGFTEGTLSWQIGDTTHERALRGPGLDAPHPGLHGPVVAYIPQHAAAALDPMLPVARLVGDVAARWRPKPDPRPWLTAAALDASPALLALRPHQLSGGMATRVVVAQALARGSRFLLADEPFSNLDPIGASEVERSLRALTAQGVGVLLITHDLHRIAPAVDHLVVVEAGTVGEARRAGWRWPELLSPFAAQVREALAEVAR